MIHLGIVEIIVTQRSCHHINTQTIGIFKSCRIIVLFYLLFRLRVFTLKQIKTGFRSSTNKEMGLISSNTRKNHCSMRLPVVNRLARLSKVVCTKNLCTTKTWYNIGIEKASIKYSYRHTFSTKSCLMKLLRIEHLHLFLCITIKIVERICLDIFYKFITFFIGGSIY